MLHPCPTQHRDSFKCLILIYIMRHRIYAKTAYRYAGNNMSQIVKGWGEGRSRNSPLNMLIRPCPAMSPARNPAGPFFAERCGFVKMEPETE